MPKPSTAGESSHTEQTANTQRANADNQQTTTQPRAEDSSNLMSYLDIPADVQSQLETKFIAPMEGDLPAADHSAGNEAERQTPNVEPGITTNEQREGALAPEAILEDDEGDDDEDDVTGQNNETLPEDQQQQQQQARPDKREKRIKKLTRQKFEAERQVDHLLQVTSELKGRLEKVEGKSNGNRANAVPSSSGWLPNITDEQQLNKEVAQARNLIKFCTANAKGIVQNEGTPQEKFITADEVAGWKSEAELVLLGSEPRRRELREFTNARTQYDTLAQRAWPELFDERTEDYQVGQTLLQNNPELEGRADKHYALGLLLEGVRSLHSRVQAAAQQVANGNGNGNGNGQRRDIDPRAFAPRVPLAPHTAETPTREVVPSSSKELNDAMMQLVSDPDGSVGSLANALSAMDKLDRTRAGSRTPVRV
jgi:hypothetical protein